jgi:hypothetical protein
MVGLAKNFYDVVTRRGRIDAASIQYRVLAAFHSESTQKAKIDLHGNFHDYFHAANAYHFAHPRQDVRRKSSKKKRMLRKKGRSLSSPARLSSMKNG